MGKIGRTVMALSAAGILLAASWALETADAQQQGSSPFIYVINVNDVFKSYEKFKRLSDDFKTDVEKKENELKGLDQIMKAKVEQIKSLTNKADRDRIEKEIAQHKFDFDQKTRNYRVDLAQKEADIYNTCYKDMSELLSQYCQQNQIPMVLRLQENEPDSGNPQAVLNTLRQSVVYHHPNLELTDVITKGLNERQRLAPQR